MVPTFLGDPVVLLESEAAWAHLIWCIRLASKQGGKLARTHARMPATHITKIATSMRIRR